MCIQHARRYVSTCVKNFVVFWAQIAAQIASEAVRIGADRLARLIKTPYVFDEVKALNVVPQKKKKVHNV